MFYYVVYVYYITMHLLLYIIMYNIQTHTYMHTFHYLFIWRNLIPHLELIIVVFIIVILIWKYFHLNFFVQDSGQVYWQRLRIWKPGDSLYQVT